jgi:arylsulfatase A
MNASHLRRTFHKQVGLAVVGLAALFGRASAELTAGTERPLNVVIVFLDDSGFSDFRPFGEPPYPTPNVARLAEQGCRFTNFHVPQAVCSASRAALLTGCYPGRTKIFGAHGPRARGLDPKWTTLGELLKTRGYATAVFGKWHIGDQPDTRPPARGFDESCGLMYSNDMWRFHPGTRHFDKWPLQFWENGKITTEDVTREQQKMLTTWYTEHAVDFIRRRKSEPFFLYVPHSMPHVPIFCSDKFEGKSGAGLYGDVMMEIDWSVGQIAKALDEAGVADNTLFIFTSDNGPWVSYGKHAGSTPYREAKATGFDGGTRSACIMRCPGHIRPGTVSESMLCSIDILPTVAGLAGATLPEHPVDGTNLWGLITNKPGALPPREYYAFSTGRTLEGVFSGDGRWKLHLPHGYRFLVTPGKDGLPGKYSQKKIGLSLFDMVNDPFETTNVIDKHPEVAKRLQASADRHKRQFYARAKPKK